MNTVERNVLDRTLNKWATYSKCRVMITSYIFAMILPTAFLIVPSWMHTIKTGFINLQPYTGIEILTIVLLAPVGETIILFIPVLEIARKLGHVGSRATIFFAVIFEALHVHRELYDHMYLFFVSLVLVAVYVAIRRRGFLPAVLMTMAVHALYNVTMLLADPHTYG